MEAWNVIDMALPLRSWTRNVPFPEGVDLLCLAEGGMTTTQWREKADEVLPHSDPAYRQTLLRLIVRMFLDLDGETILDTPFLRLLREGDEKRRRDIFFVRYALAHPWCLLAARRLILPRIEREGDAAEVSLAEWDAFVSTYIEASASEASRRKTRSTVIGVFHQLGVLERSSQHGSHHTQAGRAGLHGICLGGGRPDCVPARGRGVASVVCHRVGRRTALRARPGAWRADAARRGGTRRAADIRWGRRACSTADCPVWPFGACRGLISPADGVGAPVPKSQDTRPRPTQCVGLCRWWCRSIPGAC